MILLVGGYTQNMDPDTPGRARGISAYEFLPAEGRLDFRGYAAAHNPSYLRTDQRRKIVYAVQESSRTAGAAVLAFRLERRGAKIVLTEVSRQPVTGDDPCYLELLDDALLVCSYSSGHLHVYPLDGNGGIQPCIQDLHLSEADFTDDCRDTAHAHCVVHDRRRDRLYACDLGCDRMVVLTRADNDSSWQLRADLSLSLPAGGGGGPRHIALHPGGDYALVNCELQGKAHLLDLTGERPTLLHTEGYLPQRVWDQAKGAAIRLGAEGKNVYVSDRTFHVVTTLRIDERTRALHFRDTTPCGGEHPRDIILSPDGKWLLSANLASHSISVFGTSARGVLKLLRTNTGIPSPTSMGWMKI